MEQARYGRGRLCARPRWKWRGEDGGAPGGAVEEGRKPGKGKGEGQDEDLAESLGLRYLRSLLLPHSVLSPLRFSGEQVQLDKPASKRAFLQDAQLLVVLLINSPSCRQDTA